MTTTQADTQELTNLAHEIRTLARTFEQTAPPVLRGCGQTGRASVEQAYESFFERWQSFMTASEVEVSKLSQLVALASEAYQHQDGNVASAAAGSGAMAGSVR